MRGAVFASERLDGAGIAGVDLGGDEPRLGRMPSADGGDGALGPTHVVVGDDQAVEERTSGRDLGEGVADSSGPDQEDSHAPNLARTHGPTTDFGEVLFGDDELSTFLYQRRGKPQRKVVGMAEARTATEPVAGKDLKMAPWACWGMS